MTASRYVDAVDYFAPDHQVIRIGARSLDVTVARTPRQWRNGIKDAFARDGVLFIFPYQATFAFGMDGVGHNLILSCFDANGKVIDLAILEAHIGRRQPESPYRYALEIPVPDTVADALAVLHDIADGLAVA
jgi:uncharacterized membrane protein (UPF0127 family)